MVPVDADNKMPRDIFAKFSTTQTRGKSRGTFFLFVSMASVSATVLFGKDIGRIQEVNVDAFFRINTAPYNRKHQDDFVLSCHTSTCSELKGDLLITVVYVCCDVPIRKNYLIPFTNCFDEEWIQDFLARGDLHQILDDGTYLNHHIVPTLAPLSSTPKEVETTISHPESLPTPLSMIPTVTAIPVDPSTPVSHPVVVMQSILDNDNMKKRIEEAESQLREKDKELQATHDQLKQSNDEKDKIYSRHEDYKKKRQREATKTKDTLNKYEEERSKLLKEMVEKKEENETLSAAKRTLEQQLNSMSASSIPPATNVSYAEVYMKLFQQMTSNLNDTYEAGKPASSRKKKAEPKQPVSDPNQRTPDGFVLQDQRAEWMVFKDPDALKQLFENWSSSFWGHKFTYKIEVTPGTTFDYEAERVEHGYVQLNLSTNVKRQIYPFFDTPPYGACHYNPYVSQTPHVSCSKTKDSERKLFDQILFGQSSFKCDVRELYNLVLNKSLNADSFTPDPKVQNDDHELSTEPVNLALAELIELHSSFSRGLKYKTACGMTRCSVWIKPHFFAECMMVAMRENNCFIRIGYHGSGKPAQGSFGSSTPKPNHNLALAENMGNSSSASNEPHFYEKVAKWNDNFAMKFNWVNRVGPGVYASLSDEIASAYNGGNDKHGNPFPDGTFVIVLIFGMQNLCGGPNGSPNNDGYSTFKVAQNYGGSDVPLYQTFNLSPACLVNSGRPQPENVQHAYNINKIHNAVAGHPSIMLPIGLAYPV